MKRMIASMVFLFMVTLPMAVYAQDAGPAEAGEIVAPPNVEDDPMGFFEVLFSKIQAGEWLPVFGLVLMVLVLVVRKFLRPRIEWLGTKLGGTLLAFGMSLVLAVATSLFAGQGISLGLLATALGVAWAASGGWELVKDILGSGKEDPAPE